MPFPRGRTAPPWSIRRSRMSVVVAACQLPNPLLTCVPSTDSVPPLKYHEALPVLLPGKQKTPTFQLPAPRRLAPVIVIVISSCSSALETHWAVPSVCEPLLTCD